MALYYKDKLLTCPNCSKTLFEEIDPITISVSNNCSKINNPTIYKKNSMGKYLKCVNCGKIIKNPL